MMAPVGSGMPSWDGIALAQLGDLVHAHPLLLVEFWAPDCLFSRLVWPVRRLCAARLADRMPLLRCAVQGAEPALVAWRIWALPAVVLFEHGKARRRWIGATDARVLLHGLEHHLSARAAP